VELSSLFFCVWGDWPKPIFRCPPRTPGRWTQTIKPENVPSHKTKEPRRGASYKRLNISLQENWHKIAEKRRIWRCSNKNKVHKAGMCDLTLVLLVKVVPLGPVASYWPLSVESTQADKVRKKNND